MQDRAICERGVVLKFAEVLQGSTNSAVLFTNLQAVGNICYNNVRAQQQFAADGVLSTVNALCHARDSRISQTACRCRATFWQLLARVPEVRMSISQQAPFDPLGLSSSAPDNSDRCPSEPASPCGGQPSRPASSHSLSKLASTSLLHRRRPETSKGRLNSNSSPLEETQLSVYTLQERQQAPAANTCVPSSRGKAGWLPVKQHEIAHGLSSPPRQLFPVGAGSYSMYQPPPPMCGPSTFAPSMSVRRIPTGHPGLPNRGGISVTWTTASSRPDRGSILEMGQDERHKGHRTQISMYKV